MSAQLERSKWGWERRFCWQSGKILQARGPEFDSQTHVHKLGAVLRFIMPVQRGQSQGTLADLPSSKPVRSPASEKTMPEEQHLKLSSDSIWLHTMYLLPQLRKKGGSQNVIFRMQKLHNTNMVFNHVSHLWHNMIKNYWQSGIVSDIRIQSKGWKLNW